MARVYTREQRRRRRARRSSACSGATRRPTRTGSSTRLSVIVFTIAFSVFLYGLLRLQGHLFLNPDHLPAVPWTVALNTTASFVTNTNWQYYAGEATMSYLSQMAGLAVQQFVSAGVGLAVRRSGHPRHRAPRRRRRPRQLLARPLPVDRLHPAAALDRPRGRPDLAGRAADLPRPRDGDDAAGRAPDDRARPGRAR